MKEGQPQVSLEIGSIGQAGVVEFKTASVSDAEAIAYAGQEIKKYIEQNRPKRIVFDFSQVRFFSSQVLGLLLDIRSKLEPYGGQVVISAIEPQLHRVFRITSLDKIFQFYPDKESAATDEAG